MLQFSDLHEHKLKHDFGDTNNPMCSYRTEAGTTEYFLYFNYNCERSNLCFVIYFKNN